MTKVQVNLHVKHETFDGQIWTAAKLTGRWKTVTIHNMKGSALWLEASYEACHFSWFKFRTRIRTEWFIETDIRECTEEEVITTITTNFPDDTPSVQISIDQVDMEIK